MAAVALDAVEHLAHLFWGVAVDVVEDELGITEDGVERRAQLVAHVGEELRLVLARLGELPALVLDFVEQPHVLDRDHCLVGKRRHQLDLSIREASNRSAHQHDYADRGALAQERNAEYAACTQFSGRIAQGEFRIVQNVGHMHDAAFQRCSPCNRAATGLELKLFHEVVEVAR